MNENVKLLMQDIVFLIKRSLENSFYAESLDLSQSILIKLNRNDFINPFTDDELRTALTNLERLFFDEVESKIHPNSIAYIRLADMISFSANQVKFLTYQYYINKLEAVDYDLNLLTESYRMAIEILESQTFEVLIAEKGKELEIVHCLISKINLLLPFGQQLDGNAPIDYLSDSGKRIFVGDKCLRTWNVQNLRVDKKIVGRKFTLSVFQY